MNRTRNDQPSLSGEQATPRALRKAPDGSAIMYPGRVATPFSVNPEGVMICLTGHVDRGCPAAGQLKGEQL